MVKKKILFIRITEEQEEELMVRARKAGFSKKADYVRTVLFGNKSVEEKIDLIYREVCKNG